MTTKTAPTKYDDVIDSRDIIERIEELEYEIELRRDELPDSDAEEATCGTCGESFPDIYPSARCPFEWIHAEIQELEILKALAQEASGSPDWEYGETLIRYSYFKEYAQELAEDCGMLNDINQWPNYCIDWEWAARELQHDYFSVEFDGIEYWIRA